MLETRRADSFRYPKTGTVFHCSYLFISSSRCGGMAHACSPSAWKAVAVGGLLGVPGQPEIQDEILSQKQKQSLQSFKCIVSLIINSLHKDCFFIKYSF